MYLDGNSKDKILSECSKSSSENQLLKIENWKYVFAQKLNRKESKAALKHSKLPKLEVTQQPSSPVQSPRPSTQPPSPAHSQAPSPIFPSSRLYGGLYHATNLLPVPQRSVEVSKSMDYLKKRKKSLPPEQNSPFSQTAPNLPPVVAQPILPSEWDSQPRPVTQPPSPVLASPLMKSRRVMILSKKVNRSTGQKCKRSI